MSRRPVPSPQLRALRNLVEATILDSLRRLDVLEADDAARRARRSFARGQIAEVALSERLARLLIARRVAAAAARWRSVCEAKFNPDQPRDDHGRWTAIGGGMVSGLSAQQRNIASSLRAVIATTGAITPNTYLTMQMSGLKIGDVLGPGIYQAQFMPESGPRGALPILGTAHSQFVFIDGHGNSQILSGGPGGPHGLQLSVVKGSFDGSGTHSMGSIVGERLETISLNNVGLPVGRRAVDVWSKLNNLADMIDDASLNYNATGENSNSLFFTLAKYANLGVDLSNNTPGRDLDLFSVIRGAVPMMPSFTGPANSGNIRS